MDSLIGATLGRYRIDAPLGRGGMASVYRATDPAFRRTVAIKILDPALARDPQFVERFLRETHSTARLQHPHILPVYDVGEQNGVAYLVMQYMDGGTLRDRLKSAGGTLSVNEALALLRPIAQALDYAHQQGVIHRDVKPNNILLSAQGYPVLADFGIAKVMEAESTSALTATGTMVGTPEYMSPEQAQGVPVDGRSDLYALAIVLYEALTGRTPFRAETPTETPVSILVRHVTTSPPLPRQVNPAISPAVESVLVRALAKRPDERYPRGVDLFAALGEAAAETVAPRAPDAESVANIEQPTEIKRVTRPPSDETPMVLPVGTPPTGQRFIRPTTEGGNATPPPLSATTAENAAPPRRVSPAVYLGVGALVVLLLSVISIGTFVLVSGGAEATPTTAAVGSTPAGTTVAAGGYYQQAEPEPTRVAPVAATTPTAGGAPSPTPSPAAPSGTGTNRQEVILFSSHRGDVHDSQIFMMNPDGGNLRQVTSARGHSWGPRMSPDGKQFFFSAVVGEHTDHSARGGGQAATGNHDVYLVNADGTNITNLTRHAAWDNAWAWSPDGQWIAFTSNRDGNWEVYKMSLKGDRVVRLTSNPAQDGWPSWTPDGKQIVFASDRVGGLSQIHIMDADGANPRRLHFSESYDTYPAVSPDGKTVAYSSQVPGLNEGEIYSMNVDGSASRRLTNTVALNTEPSWSPDGSKIAFVSDQDGNSNIYVMNADGGNQVRLTNDPGEDVTPAWGYLDLPAGPSATSAALTVRLGPLNNSQQSGAATLTDLGDGTTKVVMDVQGAPAGVEQPTHIHEGTCAEANPSPTYALELLVNGKSETVVKAPLRELQAKPFVIIVHKSAREVAVYVNCGELVKSAGAAPPVTVQFSALNNSGQAGTATLTDAGNGKTKVVMNVQGGPAGTNQPAHIHEGTCADANPSPAYALADLVDGKSETVVDVPLSTLLTKPYAIIVHKSAREIAVYVNCGSLAKPASDASGDERLAVTRSRLAGEIGVPSGRSRGRDDGPSPLPA